MPVAAQAVAQTVDVDTAQVVTSPAGEAAPVVSSLKKQLIDDCASSAFGEQDENWAITIFNALVKYVSCAHVFLPVHVACSLFAGVVSRICPTFAEIGRWCSQAL